MTKTTKILVGSLLLLLVVCVAFFIIIQSIDLERYKPEITSQITQLTGRAFEIGGPVELDPGFNTLLRIDKLTLGNSEAAVSPYFATVEMLEAEVELLPLIFNELVISNVLLNGVKVWLEVNQQGQANWHFNDLPQSSESESDASIDMTVSSLQLNDTSIYYQSHGQSVHQLDIDTLTASMDEAVQSLYLVSSFQVNKKPLQMTAAIASVGQLFAGEPALTTLNGEYAESPFHVSGRLSVSESQITFNAVQLQLNGESLSATAEYQWSTAKPAIHADINFDRLNLNNLEPALTTSQKKADRLFSREVIDPSWINEINLVARLSGNLLIRDNWQLTDVSLDAAIDQGKLVLKPVFTLGEGEVKGVISMDAAASIPELEIHLDGNNILPGKVNVEPQSDWIRQSKTVFNIHATSTGNSAAQLASSLTGRFFVDIGKGKIKNEHLDLVGGDLLNELFTALNPASEKDEYTQIQCAVINLRFNNGVARYDKGMAAMTDKMMIVSSGEINLKNETLDIGFSPQPRKDDAGIGINAGELVSVARLTGKLTEPELGLDAANTAKVGAKAYGAIATGGISLLLDGLISKLMADDDPCKTARGAGVNKQQKSPSKQSGSLKSLFGF